MQTRSTDGISDRRRRLTLLAALATIALITVACGSSKKSTEASAGGATASTSAPSGAYDSSQDVGGVWYAVSAAGDRRVNPAGT